MKGVPAGRKTWTAWTSRQTQDLLDLRAEGLSSVQIAERMGRTHASVRNRLVKMGAYKPLRRRWQWLDLLRQPHTLRGAAEAMGVSLWAVKVAKGRLRRAGFQVLRASGVAAT